MPRPAHRDRIVAVPAVPPRPREAGSALVMVLIIICVLSVVAANLLLTTMARYHTTFQGASWQESIVASESGVDLAMNELRRRVVVGPSAAFQTSWTTTNPSSGKTYPGFGHAFPATTAPYNLPAILSVPGGVEGNTATQMRVYVDVPGSDAAPSDFAVASDNAFISQLDNPKLRDADGVDRSRWWYRIRALGIAGVSGPARPNLDKRDNGLRRLSFFTDWRTGRSLSSPQVARMVEVVVKPLTNFRNALMADQQINLSNMDVLVDSYDSSKGYYSSTINHGTMGNIATNGTLINANHATVNGNAMTNNGTVNDGDKVTGQQSGNFYQELTPFTAGLLDPAWSDVKDGGTLTADTTFKASANAASPALVRLDGINLASGSNTIAINAPDGAAASAPSFIKIYVQGDIATRDGSFINIQAGVNAIIYFTGNVNLQGNGIFNNSMLANHLVLNGLQPPANLDGTFPARTVSIATDQDFEGIVYAPNHDVNLALQAASAGTSGQDASGLLGELQANQTQAIADFHQAYTTFQNDMAAVGISVPTLTLVVGTVASNLYTMLPAPTTGKTTSDLVTLQAALNKVAQTQVQIESLQGTLMASQAEDHARGYNGIYGGFVARTITVAEKTHVHYDETLRTAGPVNHYEIVNWFEDNASRDAIGGAERFWW